MSCLSTFSVGLYEPLLDSVLLFSFTGVTTLSDVTRPRTTPLWVLRLNNPLETFFGTPDPSYRRPSEWKCQAV